MTSTVYSASGTDNASPCCVMMIERHNDHTTRFGGFGSEGPGTAV